MGSAEDGDHCHERTHRQEHGYQALRRAGDTGWCKLKVGAILDGGRQMELLARQAKIELVELSVAKQTDTTLRWKIGLRSAGHREVIRTKIEFSGRGGGSDAATTWRSSLPVASKPSHGSLTQG